ncbi:MAG: DUF1735 domain-containing protein [Bacteroidales bacterium]|nr:DUF1735 domain-containing protein [Bacteroidales bacterium]
MRKIIYTISALFVLALASCSKGDGDLNYGLTKIYMPQAMAGGGITNIYNVPSGGGSDTYNFSEDDENYNVYLGVLRSGKEAGEGFSVEIVTDAAETSRQAKELEGYAMPSNVYTLPSSVSVEAGKNSASFSLTLNKAALKSHAGKKLVLCAGLANPSRYELSENGTLVTIVVDVDALMAK